MKKLVVSLVVSVLCLSGCSKTSTPEAVKGSYTKGTYTASATGHNSKLGPIMVEVVFSETEIESIEVVEHFETEGIADVAVSEIPNDIVTHQSLAVDNYTGATITSAAIKAAVADAVGQANGDVEVLKSKTIAFKKEDITIETDIVVVGAGGAGLSAAVEASRTGAKVLVIEQNGMQGGSTARSGGKLLATNTKQQKAVGLTDSPIDFANYLNTVGQNKVDAEKIGFIAEQSGPNIAWLEDMGVVFSDSLEPLHPMINPMRGHFTIGGGGMSDGKGGSITNALRKAAESTNTEFMFQTTAQELILKDGEVVGVKALKKDGSMVTINAKAVLLATGGYDYNKELFDELAPKAKAGFHTVSSLHTGSGLMMAKNAGAKIVAGGGAITLYLDFSTGAYEPSGLYVSPSGTRFMDESLFWFTRTQKMMEEDIQNMFWITDSKSDAYGLYDGQVEAGKMFKAETVAELATSLGMDTETLTNTVKRYNDIAKTGVDTDFNKPGAYLEQLEGTLYAIPFGSVSSGTMGGPLTDINGQVINQENQLIAGLYAVGEVANGDLMHTEYPGSGSSITMCIALGRWTGQKIAESIK